MSGVEAQVPVAEELFRVDDDGAGLIGSRCTGCGTHYFPRTGHCRNPECDDKSLEPAVIGRRGRLYSWTVQRYRPPAPFRMDSWQPYALGLIELPEGLRVMAMLSGIHLDEISIDMPLELAADALYTDDEERSVLTYKYRPVHA